MSSLAQHKGGKAYWRSLDELAGTPEFRNWMEREFPVGASEVLDSSSRRQFLKAMGASFALAGLTACRWPKENIVPHARRVAGHDPGVPLQFATSMELGGSANGLLVTSYDGRPIKIEGNPSHPINQGTADTLAQASVLDLYDPDRAKHPVQRDRGKAFKRSWSDFSGFVEGTLRAQSPNGEGLYILSGSSSSPSLAKMREQLRAFMPQAAWLEYDPVSRDNEREGARVAFGRPVRTHLDFAKADVVLSLDADFLGDDPAALRNARGYGQGRQPKNGSMSRIYVVESTFSTSGAMADHRLALAPSQIQPFALALARELAEKHGLSLPSLPAAGEHHFPSAFISALANDLAAAAGKSLITVGPRQPAGLHALVHTLNSSLSNVGKSVYYTNDPGGSRVSHSEDIRELAGAAQSGKVNGLIILGGNPAYDAPADLALAKLLADVPNSIHLTLSENETSKLCTWQLPQAHYLESWGDALAYDGTYCAVQPLIEPLYGGKSSCELLALLAGDPSSGYEIVRRTFQSKSSSGDLEKNWRVFLHEGFLADSALPQLNSSTLRIQGDAVQSALSSGLVPSGKGLEIVFTRDSKVYDGRFANNGWLQELPDFMTKITWDNAAIIGPKTAEEVGVSNEEIVKLSVDGREVEIVAYILPGQAAGAVTVHLGYGREAVGKVGEGVGVNVYPLRSSDAMDFATGAAIEPTGGHYELSCTQDHHAIDDIGQQGRDLRVADLIREGNLDTYNDDPEFVKKMDHHPPAVDLWQPHAYDGNKWGLAIDLNSCTGCNACVVACQSENNIPVVGKEQVGHGREMHWIRVDRYFSGDVEDPKVVQQPIPCMHCENAPCEQVCPVAATVHSSEGLNAMVYNRCVGTRYCSNNCPYKVRRFNFFNYHKDMQETEKMGQNPDVTVRSRGVMEKCTYCVQRIESVKIKAKNEKRAIEDGEIRTACQQTCPTQAIHFGDLNDPNSKVAQLQKDPRDYEMLGYLHLRARTHYLAKLRNPNPDLIETTDEHSSDATHG